MIKDNVLQSLLLMKSQFPMIDSQLNNLITQTQNMGILPNTYMQINNISFQILNFGINMLNLGLQYSNPMMKYNLKYQIPEKEDLTEKYPIKYPTKYIDENGKDFLKIVLEGFDNWNKGIDYYIKWVDENFDENATSSSLDDRNRTMENRQI